LNLGGIKGLVYLKKVSYIKNKKMKNLRYLKAYFSPFKPLKPRFYIGKTAVGVPYFYPRKWVKATPKLAIEEALKEIKRVEDFNERNKNNGHSMPIREFDKIYAEKMRYSFPVDKKIGFDFCELGWKTKWTAKDIRFEYAPVWSFVFFGYQIAITWNAPEQDHYWESWIYYEYYTDKSKSKSERIEQCREEFPNIWTRHSKGEEETINYYDLILRKKYL
jgi:hypothetical protein